MSRLLRVTTCDGKPGSCTVKLTRNGSVSQPRNAPNLQKLETRLYQIHRELQKVHPQDIHLARKLQQDAEFTASIFRAANRGDLTINVSHIMNRINEIIKSGFGKVGEFFTYLSQREPTLDTVTPLDVQDAITGSEKQRFISTVRFRKVLPSL